MPRLTEVVKSLIIINVIMYFGTTMLPPEWRTSLALYFPLSDFFRPYQLVTHLFMHGSLVHLLFNMYALFLFGSALETIWGPKRFLYYYLFTGFGAVVLSLLVKYFEYQSAISAVDPETLQLILEKGGDIIRNGQNYSEPLLGKINGIINYASWGASGSVFGLLAAYAMKFPRNRLGIFPLPFMIEAKYFVLIYAGIELFLGISGANTGIAHFAHLGGALFGYLLVRYWEKNGSRL